MIDVRLVTPEGVYYKGKADYVEFDAVGERLRVYEGHMPLVSVLANGEIDISIEGRIENIPISSGIASVFPDSISIAAERKDKFE